MFCLFIVCTDAIKVALSNARSLFREKLRKWGRKNVPETDDPTQDFEEFQKLGEREDGGEAEIEENQEESREKKTFLLFGRSLFKSKK